MEKRYGPYPNGFTNGFVKGANIVSPTFPSAPLGRDAMTKKGTDLFFREFSRRGLACRISLRLSRDLHIYNYGNTGNVMIYDISGRLLFQRHLYPNGITTIALQKQTVYIVKTTIPNETRSTKIIID
jgi:hypothetical protein